MRLYELSEWFDQAQKAYPNKYIVHVCEVCNWKTPNMAPLDVMISEIPIYIPEKVEIKDNLCDSCNNSVWKKIADHSEH